MHARRKPHTGLLGALLAMTATLALAAPAMLKLKNGAESELEIVGYLDGYFVVRDKQGVESRVLAGEVRSIAFKDNGRSSAANRDASKGNPAERPGDGRAGPEQAHPLTVDEVQRRAEEHRFPMMLILFQTSIQRTGPARMTQIERELGERLQRADLSRESRRDLGLAQVLARLALGNRNGADALLAQLRADYRNDPVLQRFDTDVQRALERRSGKERAADREPAPLPLKETPTTTLKLEKKAP